MRINVLSYLKVQRDVEMNWLIRNRRRNMWDHSHLRNQVCLVWSNDQLFYSPNSSICKIRKRRGSPAISKLLSIKRNTLKRKNPSLKNWEERKKRRKMSWKEDWKRRTSLKYKKRSSQRSNKYCKRKKRSEKHGLSINERVKKRSKELKNKSRKSKRSI